MDYKRAQNCSNADALVVPHIHCHGLALKYISEKIWQMGEPEMLISVNGGAADFNLGAETSERVFQGLMKAQDEMKVWFVSGGTNSGVMKLLGRARTSEAPNAPLIGVPAFGAIKDHKSLLAPESLDHSAGVDLEPHHSHFLLVDDGTNSLGGASHRARAAFEKAVRNRERVDDQERKMSAEGIQRTGGLVKVPYVCVVIEGGPGTILQVYEVAKQEMITLCIKGTGRAADFLGDLALLRYYTCAVLRVLTASYAPSSSVRHSKFVN